MAARDFSTPIGRRLRIPLTIYDPDTKTFRAVPQSAALVTVANEREEKRLWKAIEKTIGGGEWRNGAAGSADRSDPVEADV